MADFEFHRNVTDNSITMRIGEAVVEGFRQASLDELSKAIVDFVAKDETIREKIRVAIADAVSRFDREIVFAGVKAIAQEQLAKK